MKIRFNWLKCAVIFFLLSFAGVLSASAQSKRVTVNVKNATLQKVFSQIEKQTDYHFSYLDAQVKSVKNISINERDAAVSHVLDKCLSGTGLSYEIISDKTIVVFQKNKSVVNGNVPQQTKSKKVTGLVTDNTGEPIIGATIKEMGSDAVAITDVNGNFSIQPTGTNVLLLSYIGFKTQTVNVQNRSNVNVVLDEERNELEELVVTGYNSQRRQEITGSVADISRKEMLKTTSANLTNALQGKVPGLNIKKNSDEPGSFDSSFSIRGLGSPLVIVDGVPRDNFNRIDANEIESISVIKDASAAIYGVRAANGVILVTTRHGQKGSTEITMDASYGWQSVTRFPEGVDAYGYMELYNEAMANKGETVPTFNNDLVTSGSPYANVNWYDEVVKSSAPQARINVTASGGNDNIQFFNSIGYYSEEGLWKSNSLDYSRFNLRSNVSAKISKRLKAEFQIGGYYDRKNAPAYYPSEIFKAIGAAQPIYEVYANGNPSYLGYQAKDEFNAVIKSTPDISGYRKTNNIQLNVTASVSWDIPWVDGLTGKAQVSFDPTFHNDKLFNKQYKTYKYNKEDDTYSVVTTSEMSSITEWRNYSLRPNTQLSLNYVHSFADTHNLKALLLFETSKYEWSELSGGRNTLMDAVDQIYAGLVDDARSVSSGADRYSNAGLVGRIDYDYMSKYIAQISFRYDGSSKFHNKRWGFFPSLSLGWRVSEEKWFKNALPFVSNFKIRGSIGKMGDDSANSYLWLTAFSYPGSDSYVLGSDGTVVPGVGMPEIANANATWYTATTKNLGFEVGMWNSALKLEFDVFRRDRDGLWASKSVSVPSTFGATFSQENINSDMNYGFEFVLGSEGKIGEVNYSVSGNLTFTQSRNRYVQSAAFGNSYENWRNNTNDRNNNIVWMYNAIGQFTSIDQVYRTAVLNGTYNQYDYLPGDIIYEDYNEDGMIDSWDEQPLRRGSTPVMNYGLSMSAEWKGLDISLAFQGASMFNTSLSISPLIWSGSAWNIFMDRWHKEDPFDAESPWIAGKYPSTRIESPQNYGTTSTFWYNDCSYLRLKNLEIGYTLPFSWTHFLGVKSLRVYFNGYNLLTWQAKESNYADPENPGGQLSSYPIMKNINFGVNVKF